MTKAGEHLLIIDLGIRTEFALDDRKYSLTLVRSQNFGNRHRLIKTPSTC